ncbi:C40 family peptidase [Limibaculum sp. M0105]|uniref:C40 family peptidase n=1 Tax=Thermohalobaculum xanthum TaxID=2753746 RepID=A0A8J7M907_9RHOB|nr:NlpC/P60 family protein [Thermohalobaculum xanthum]MBK0400358.1 C40 family peptidase [Thermohalobaculum xanthum]
MSGKDTRLALSQPGASAVDAPDIAAPDAGPTPMRVIAPTAPLMREAGGGRRGLDTELLLGESFVVEEVTGEWCRGRSALDCYRGHVPAKLLGQPGAEPTHRVARLMTHLYAEPDIKTRPLATLSYGSRLAVVDTTDAKGTRAPMARLARGGLVIADHLEPLVQPAQDWVAEAERLLGVPYLWGGRSSFGIDCSALVQLARQAAGAECPRDSGDQEQALGATLAPGTTPARGDLIFWRGHVGIMLDAVRLLHANAHHMAAAIEPLAEAVARIEAAGGGPVTRHARLDGGARDR